MVAIGCGLMGRPDVLLLDEPSLGLAPQVSQQVFDALRRLRELGSTMVIVEQNDPAAQYTLDAVVRAYDQQGASNAEDDAWGCEGGIPC